MASKSDSQSSAKRPDGRRPSLVYLHPQVIQTLKIEALEKKTHAYLLQEEILKARDTAKS